MSHFTVLVELAPGQYLTDVMESFYEQGDPEDYFMMFEPQMSIEEARLTELPIIMEHYQRKADEGDPKYLGYLADCEAAKNDDELLKKVIIDWQGGIFQDDHFGYICNPQAKWDWYVIGGRWGHLLKIKPNWEELNKEPPMQLLEPDYQSVEERIAVRHSTTFWIGFQIKEFEEKVEKGELVFSSEEEKTEALAEYIGATPDCSRANGAFKCQIDFERMESDRIRRRMNEWYKKRDWIELKGYELNYVVDILNKFKAIPIEEFPPREKRDTHPVVKAYDEIFAGPNPIESPWGWGEREMTATLEEWTEGYERAEALTYAFLTADGEWNEPGQMLMFGMSTGDENTRKEYSQVFWEWIDSVPDDHFLVVVDCHI